MANYTVIVRLIAYDTLAVTAESPADVVQEVRRILRNEQKYQQTRYRPLLGEIQTIKEENGDADVEVLWRRGEDPLNTLLVGKPAS